MGSAIQGGKSAIAAAERASLLGNPSVVRVVGAVATLAVSGVLLTACSGSSPGARPSTRSGPTVSTAPTLASSPAPVDSLTPSASSVLSSAAASAVAAYDAMWQDMATAATTADYQSPLLAHHAAGDALSVLTRGLYTDKRLGLVVRGEPVMHPKVTQLLPEASPTKATIVDCFDDRNWLNYKASGGLQNNTPGGLHRTTAVVTDINGTWKVTELAAQGPGTC